MAAEKDQRTYIRIHDGMPDHPKIEGLSDAAFRLLVTTWCWSSRHLTDGRVPAGSWSKRGDEESRTELLATGLADVLDDGSVRMHDYTDHQRTAEEVQRIKEARREAGSKGGKARANAIATTRANAQAKALANAQANSKQNLPIDIDIDKEQKNMLDADASSDRFNDFWAIYPRRVGKGAARKAWASMTKRGTEIDTVLHAAAQFAVASANLEPKFVPHPATWLNSERYDDDPAPTQPDGGSTRRYLPVSVPDHIDPDDVAAYTAWANGELRGE